MPSLSLGLNISLGLLFISVMITLIGSVKNKKRIIALGIVLWLISFGAILFFRFFVF